MDAPWNTSLFENNRSTNSRRARSAFEEDFARYKKTLRVTRRLCLLKEKEEKRKQEYFAHSKNTLRVTRRLCAHRDKMDVSIAKDAGKTMHSGKNSHVM